MNVAEVTLTGDVVRLSPMRREDAGALFEAGGDAATWQYVAFDAGRSLEAMQQWVDSALAARDAGVELPFVIHDQADGRVLGSTRYLNISLANRNLEIGWTWLRPDARRSVVNTECKYLLLRHAFEALHVIRVQLKTDSRNLASRRAIQRIGAVEEGILRKYQINHDGYQRDTAFYSILDTEWPHVRENLKERMGRREGRSV